MTEATRGHLNDNLAVFRRRYVREQSVATARCKWENLSFNPSQQTFPDFLEQYQKLAQEAYGEDAPRFIETSFYAKMPPHLKRVLNQARPETESYETMVQNLEREIELNGLATTDSPSITGVHNLEPNLQQQQEKLLKTTGTCSGCGNPGSLLRNCRKTNRNKRSQRNQNPTQTTPCETCGNESPDQRLLHGSKLGKPLNGGKHPRQHHQTMSRNGITRTLNYTTQLDAPFHPVLLLTPTYTIQTTVVTLITTLTYTTK